MTPLERVSGRFYRVLLLLLPRSFRREWGPEMALLFQDCLAAERARGGPWLFRAWRESLPDLARTILREWRSQISPTRFPSSHGDSMGSLFQDLRYAGRSLRRSPGFTLVILASLALGIGANTLVFSLVDGVVLRPFDWPEAHRVVGVGVAFPKIDPERRYIETFAGPEFVDVREGARTLASTFAFDLGNRNLSGGDRPERVFTGFIFGDPFATIGLPPHLGRGFTWEESSQESRVVILSYRLWRSRFGADSSIIGRGVQVNGVPFTVTGVMPRELLLAGTDLWVPMGTDPRQLPRTWRGFAIVGRLAPGATREQLDAELAAVARRTEDTFRAERPEYEGWSLTAKPFAEVLTGEYRTLGAVLLGAVGLVLLIACANIASLLLARSATRGREIAVRRALGAGNRRIARQLLTESLLLAGLGAALGAGLAAVLLEPVIGLLPDIMTRAGLSPSLNGRVLLYTLSLGLASAVVFGLAPVWRAVRGTRSDVLSPDSTRTTLGHRGKLLRHAFAVLELAVALTLLAGAGILVRGFLQLQQVDAGFDRENVLTMRLSLPQERYNRPAVAAFFEELSTRLEAVPGVVRAAAATQFPPGNGFTARVAVQGEVRETADIREVDVTNATERFFQTLGYTLLRGRGFTAVDHETAPRVAVVNQSAALRLFGQADPLGRRIRLGEGDDRPWIEIVGLVQDVRNRGLDTDPAPEVFVPVRQMEAAWNNQLFLVIRTRSEPLALLPSVRSTIESLDAEQPAYEIQTLEQRFAEAGVQRRVAAILLGVLSGIALGLAAVGIYGLLNYLVSERTQEIGIRLALGAEQRDVLWMIVRQTGLVLGIGAGLGLTGALLLGRGLGSLTYGISPTDPATLTSVTLLLLAVGLVAGLLPARRATRVDPVVALKG
jgi:predicted permease